MTKWHYQRAADRRARASAWLGAVAFTLALSIDPVASFDNWQQATTAQADTLAASQLDPVEQCPALDWYRSQDWQCSTDSECEREEAQRLTADAYPVECAGVAL